MLFLKVCTYINECNTSSPMAEVQGVRLRREVAVGRDPQGAVRESSSSDLGKRSHLRKSTALCK